MSPLQRGCNRSAIRHGAYLIEGDFDVHALLVAHGAVALFVAPLRCYHLFDPEPGQVAKGGGAGGRAGGRE